MVRSMSKRYAEVTGREEPFLYSSRPGDGTVKYEFQNKTCIGGPAAHQYMTELLVDAGIEKESA